VQITSYVIILVLLHALRISLHPTLVLLHLVLLGELDLVVELRVVLLVDGVVLGLERARLITDSLVGGGLGQLLNSLELLLGKVNG
jgi:hypothetical protein